MYLGHLLCAKYVQVLEIKNNQHPHVSLLWEGFLLFSALFRVPGSDNSWNSLSSVFQIDLASGRQLGKTGKWEGGRIQSTFSHSITLYMRTLRSREVR